MWPSCSADKMQRLRGDRPQCSYTIDTPSWDDEKSRFRAFRNNPCVGNRNVTIALVGFVGAILAVVGAFAYVHGTAREAYEPPVNDDASTAAAETPALVAVALAAANRRPSPSTPVVAAAPRLVNKTPPARRHPVARAERRSPRRTTRKQHLRGRAAPTTGQPRRRQRATMTRAGMSRRTTIPKLEEAVTTLSGPQQKRKQQQQQQQQPQQTRSPSPRRLADDEDDSDDEDKVAASTPLPKHLVPRHYSVLLHPHNDGSHFVFTGVVKVTAKCVESTRQVVLHAAGIQVNNAKVSFNVVAANRSAVHYIQVRRVDVNNSTQQVTLELASFLHAQVIYDISISYVGMVSRWPKGLYKASYKLKNGSEGWMAFTRMKPMYARRVFPCFDEPSFRSTFDVEILRRKDFNSIASMPIFKIEMSTNHNDYVNDVFVRTPPIPTYLLGFAVTDFKHIGTGIVKVWSEPSLHTRAEFVLQTANTCLQLYEKYFQTRYPLPKLDIIITPAAGEPCESEGIVFLPSSHIARSNLSLDARKQAESSVYRHVLKQWIGGLVSFHTWRELWLDAALEAYILYALARMQNTKSAEDDDRFEIKMQQMLSLEASQDIPALSRENSSLDTDASLAVRKGELLLHMFDSAVGSNGIRNALQELMVKRKHQTITEQDLWEELSNVNNESFPGAHVAHAWTHSAGFPLLTISRVYGQRVAVARQERYGQNASQTVWNIPVTYTDGTKMDFDDTGSIFWLTTKEAKLPSAPKDDDWLIANLRGCGYYRVNYDPRNWNLITMELNTYHTNIDVVNRARIIDDVFELADLGIVPYGTALHASEYLRREKETLPWTTVLKRWEYLEAMLGTGVVLEKWKLFIIRILIHHIHSFKWSYTQEDNDKRQLRIIHYAWACRYKYGPCLIEARHAFEIYKSSQPTSKPILLEHQLTVFCTVIEDGDEGEWMGLRTRLEQVSDGVERRNIILALGCTKDRSRLHRYFKEFSAPSMRMVPLLFTEPAKRGNFWRLRTAEYILANWKELKTTYPRHFQGILTSIFKYVSSNEELLEVNKLLRRNRWSLLRYSTAFDTIDQAAKKNIQWVASHYAEVARWLKRDVAEFILDDQVLHGNATLSGLGNDTRNEDETDSLDVGASEVFKARGIPDYRVTDGAIAKENNSGSDSDIAGLGDTARERSRSSRAGDSEGTTTMMRDFGDTFRAKHNADSREVSATVANTGVGESHNKSIEASNLEAIHGHQSMVNNADGSAVVEVPLVTGESLPDENDSVEASSPSNPSQTQKSNTTRSVTRNSDTAFSSLVASRVGTAEIAAKNAKFDTSIFKDSGQDPQLAEYAKDEDYTGTRVIINDFDHILITKHFRDSHNALEVVKRAGPSRNLNGSRDIKYKRMTERAASSFTAAYRDEGAANNGSRGVHVEMAKATAENFPKNVEFFKNSESSRNRSEGGKNKTDIRRGVDIARVSYIAPQMNAAEIATEKAESEAFFLKDVEENLGYSKHAQDYTDTTITIWNFDDIFLTKHYIDSRGTYVAAESTGLRGSPNGNSDASARVADRPRRYVGAAHKDESVSEGVSNEPTVGPILTKPEHTEEKIFKEKSFFRMSQSSPNESQGSENRMDADMARSSSVVSWVNTPMVAAEKVETLVAGPKDREQNHNDQSYASYIAAFSQDKRVANNGNIRVEMPAVTGEKLPKKGGPPKISSHISRSENRNSKDPKDGGRDTDTRSNASVLSLVSAAGIAADDPRFDSVELMDDELNTEYMEDKDYTDTTIILENFDDRFLTRHYIDSHGAPVVAEGTGLDGTFNYSIDKSIKGRATSQLSTIPRGNAVLENLFAEGNHRQNSGFLKMLRSTPFEDQKSKNRMVVERNGDAERSPSVYLVNAPKIKAEVGLNTDSRCLSSSSGSCKGAGQHASNNSLVNGGGKSFKAEEQNTAKSNEDGRNATFLPIYSNADGIKVDDNVNERKDYSHITTSAGFSPSMVLLLRGNTSGIAVEHVNKMSNGTVRTTHRSSEDSAKKCDEATSSALTIKPRMAPSMIPFTNSYGKIPRAPNSVSERTTASTKESGDVRCTPNNEVNSDINVSDNASATNVASAVTISIIRKITGAGNGTNSFSSTIVSSTNVTKPSKSPSASRATEDRVKVMNTSETTSITNSARKTNAPVTIFPSSDNAGTLSCNSTSTHGQQRNNVGDSGDVHNDSYDGGNEENVDSEYAMREDSARDDHKKLRKLAGQ